MLSKVSNAAYNISINEFKANTSQQNVASSWYVTLYTSPSKFATFFIVTLAFESVSEEVEALSEELAYLSI